MIQNEGSICPFIANELTTVHAILFIFSQNAFFFNNCGTEFDAFMLGQPPSSTLLKSMKLVISLLWSSGRMDISHRRYYFVTITFSH